MKIKKPEIKVKPDIKVGIPFDTNTYDLRTLDTNVIVDFLEQQMKLRDQSFEENLKKKLIK